MYILQISLISFEEIIKFQQETKLEIILPQIYVSKVANALRKSSDSRGSKGYKPVSLIYSLIAMQIEKIHSIKDLVLKPKENPILRYCCGFDVLGKVSSESTFSRFFDKLANTQELELLFHELVIKAKNLNIVDFNSICSAGYKLVYWG